MAQRGYRSDDLSFVIEHGTELDGGYILTDRDVLKLEAEARLAIKLAQKLRGTLVPHRDGTIKTVFKASKVQLTRWL